MSKKPTLLYVEDEDGIRDELSRFLKHFCSELFIAKDGQEGFELYKKHLPDIIVSDIKMPKMNGIEMIKAIKEINPRQYILFTTAHSESNYFIEAIEIRINGLILKPIDLDSLSEKLQFIIDQIEMKNTKELYEGYLLQQPRLAQIGEMISMIAHQWRQPLSTISAISTHIQLSIELERFDLAKEQDRKKQEIFLKKELHNLDDNLEYLSNIINGFSNFYKPDDTLVPTKLKDTVDKALSIINLLIASDEITITCNSDILVNIYVNELSQVIVNLLKNAQECLIANKVKNPKIDIIIDDYKIKICDNGGGIDTNILDKVFDPYFSTKGKKNGRGLGLYMSKVIVEKHHHGKLNVLTTSDGVCFEIDLTKNIDEFK